LFALYFFARLLYLSNLYCLGESVYPEVIELYSNPPFLYEIPVSYALSTRSGNAAVNKVAL
jgi:hypothetical protein